MQKNRMVKLLFALLIACSFSACAAYGGGTIGTGLGSDAAFGGGTSGTGLSYGNAGNNSDSGVSYFPLHGVLTDSQNRPIVGAEVKVQTTRNEETIVTDISGNFQSDVIAEQGEEMQLEIRYLNKSMGYRIAKLPGNIQAASIQLRIGSSGKLQLIDISYEND